MKDEGLFDMDDAALEAAFKEAKAEFNSPDTEVEETYSADEEETEEQVDEDTEQPEEDSDDNGEEVVDEVATEEVSEEKTEDVKTEEVTETQTAQKRKYKANGKEFEFSDDEIFDQFGKVFGQAMNYTQKMQAIAPYRSIIETVKDQRLTQEDMNLMVDVLKGDKQALAAVMKRTGIDALDVDTDVGESYIPKNYGRNDTELAIQDIVEEIGKDPEYPVTYHIVEKQWDSKSREAFVKNPDLIKDLHIDVRNGVFDKVSPMMMKLKVLDGGRKSDIEYYVEAGKNYYAEQAKASQYEQANAQRLAKLEADRVATEAAERDRISKAKAEQAKRDNAQDAVAKRKAAAPTTTRADKKTVTDYLDESDEEYDTWYKKLQDRF